jgi:hypothetical protein
LSPSSAGVGRRLMNDPGNFEQMRRCSTTCHADARIIRRLSTHSSPESRVQNSFSGRPPP